MQKKKEFFIFSRNQENNHTITPNNTTDHKTNRQRKVDNQQHKVGNQQRKVGNRQHKTDNRQGKVGNRLPGGCVGVLADNGGGIRVDDTMVRFPHRRGLLIIVVICVCFIVVWLRLLWFFVF
jgi:hypothetical protein